MTILQRLRGILPATQTTYAPTTAEQLRATWEGATIRDPVFRADMTRRSVRQDHAAVSCLWRFEDGSVLVANDQEIFVL